MKTPKPTKIETARVRRERLADEAIAADLANPVDVPMVDLDNQPIVRTAANVRTERQRRTREALYDHPRIANARIKLDRAKSAFATALRMIDQDLKAVISEDPTYVKEAKALQACYLTDVTPVTLAAAVQPPAPKSAPAKTTRASRAKATAATKREKAAAKKAAKVDKKAVAKAAQAEKKAAKAAKAQAPKAARVRRAKVVRGDLTDQTID